MGGGDASAAAEGSESPAAPSPATINVRCSNGTKFAVQSNLDAMVGSFKGVVAGSCSVPAEQQRLIYKGRILKDDQTLRSYGMESDHTIHLVRGAAPSAPQIPPASTGVNFGASTIPNSANETGSRTLGSNEGGGLGGAGFGGSPFPGLGVLGGSGASGLFGSGAGLPELDQVHQQLAQNPNMMRDIMNMPVVQNLMNNPDLMRNLIMNNPQMREIIDRNPDLAHILNDPSILRQTLEAARNPELMREMMRNTDRAMSNIESSPEGFNMLRRMYETVQEPFLNATTMTGESGTDLGSNPFAALLGNQGARARDASTNPSTTGSEAATGSPAPNTNPLPNPWNNATGAGQNNNTRPSPGSGDARTPGIAGLGGLGLPDLERMLGGSQDSSPFGRILENPAMTQMMQSLLSNPQYMNQILSSVDPSNVLGSNTQFREMLQNPEFLQQLTSPETLRQLRTFQQSLFGLQQQGQEQNQTGTAGTGTPNNMGLEFLVNMFGGGLGGAGGLGVPNTSNVPPEELYATQLSQLQEMGFFDTQENIRALSATAGNVHAAVERLLGNLGQ